MGFFKLFAHLCGAVARSERLILKKPKLRGEIFTVSTRLLALVLRRACIFNHAAKLVFEFFDGAQLCTRTRWRA